MKAWKPIREWKGFLDKEIRLPMGRMGFWASVFPVVFLSHIFCTDGNDTLKEPSLCLCYGEIQYNTVIFFPIACTRDQVFIHTQGCKKNIRQRSDTLQ